MSVEHMMQYDGDYFTDPQEYDEWFADATTTAVFRGGNDGRRKIWNPPPLGDPRRDYYRYGWLEALDRLPVYYYRVGCRICGKDIHPEQRVCSGCVLRQEVPF